LTEALLLDTHIALWLDAGHASLHPSTRTLIDGCWQGGGTIRLSAVSVWEIALLVDSNRIQLDLPIEDWVTRFVQRPGIEAVPLIHRAAARSYRLHQLEHRDPADRLLIATAIELACPLVTYDDRSCALPRIMARNMGSGSAPDFRKRAPPGHSTQEFEPLGTVPLRRLASAAIGWHRFLDVAAGGRHCGDFG
jgi:PIN domain nuclease of toxin-antitoxin system